MVKDFFFIGSRELIGLFNIKIDLPVIQWQRQTERKHNNTEAVAASNRQKANKWASLFSGKEVNMFECMWA